VPKKYGEVRRALPDLGWEMVRQRGSHETWGSGDGRRLVTVAGQNSETVPRGTLGALRRATGFGRLAMKQYLVIYEQAEDGGWGAHSPDVEGAFALGSTREEAEARMAEALASQLEQLRERGLPIPEPRTEAGRVAA
jgi:predicted RNase H-like HicB family nuclease/predicted RNA binding protein YcfA (HicA-like mRNA interferase family)